MLNKTSKEVIPSTAKSDFIMSNFPNYVPNSDMLIEFLEVFNEVIREVKDRSPKDVEKVLRFQKALKEKLEFFTAKKAYDAGLNAENVGEETAFMSYLSDITLDTKFKSLTDEIQSLFNDFSNLLSSGNNSVITLLDEFKEISDLCYGFNEKNLSSFFNHGYVMREMNMKLEWN